MTLNTIWLRHSQRVNKPQSGAQQSDSVGHWLITEYEVAWSTGERRFYSAPAGFRACDLYESVSGSPGFETLRFETWGRVPPDDEHTCMRCKELATQYDT